MADLLYFNYTNVPDEILLNIFKYLPPEDLCKKTNRVCKLWNALSADNSLWNAFDLKKLFPSVKFLDETVWKAHVDLVKLKITFEDAQPIDNRIAYLALKRLLGLRIDGNAGVTVLTLPKGLTFEALTSLANSKSISIEFVWPRIDKFCRTLCIEKTQTVAITNSTFFKSNKLSDAKQDALLNKIGCEKPGVLALSSLALLTRISQQPPVLLFKGSTYSISCDGTAGYNLVAGGNNRAGFKVDDNDAYFGVNHSGVACQVNLSFPKSISEDVLPVGRVLRKKRLGQIWQSLARVATQIKNLQPGQRSQIRE